MAISENAIAVVSAMAGKTNELIDDPIKFQDLIKEN